MTKTSQSSQRRAIRLGVVDAWVAQQRTPSTQSAYRSDFNAFARWCGGRGAVPLDVDGATFAAFMAARQAAGDSASTLQRRWASLGSFFRFAVDASATEVNPLIATARTPSPSPMSPTTVLSPGSVDAYLATAAALDPRLEALVALLVLDGLKLGEALALDVNDISGRLPKMSLVVRRKGEQHRIELTAPTGRAVHRCANRRRGEPLFVSARGGRQPDGSHRLTRFGADHLIRQLSQPGDDRVTANILRRYHFANSRAAGVDTAEVLQRTGLADARSLRRYTPDSQRTTST